jgi:hypothetical protein
MQRTRELQHAQVPRQVACRRQLAGLRIHQHRREQPRRQVGLAAGPYQVVARAAEARSGKDDGRRPHVRQGIAGRRDRNIGRGECRRDALVPIGREQARHFL